MKRCVIIMLVFLMALSASSVSAANESALCSDSDGGKNYSVFGRTCIEGSCMLDSCLANGLNEGYCEGNESYTEEYTCPYACENGKCIGRSETKVMIACNDSDGKGNYWEKGQITLKYNDSTSERINDLCGTDASMKKGARDYYCIETEGTYSYSIGFRICECDDGVCAGEPEVLPLAEDNEPAENEQDEISETGEPEEELDEEQEEQKETIAEKENGEDCANNYGCKSNLCADGKCASTGFFAGIIRWILSLF